MRSQGVDVDLGAHVPDAGGGVATGGHLKILKFKRQNVS